MYSVAILAQAIAGMVSLEDVKALLESPFPLVVQFVGLPVAGTLALLSRNANSSMKGNLTSLLSTLREIEVDIDKPLFSAARGGFDAVVSALVAAGADKNKAMLGGVTPLLIADQKGHETVVSALVGAGADKNTAKQDGVTPLLVAAHNGHEAVVSALLTFSGITAPAESNG